MCTQGLTLAWVWDVLVLTRLEGRGRLSALGSLIKGLQAREQSYQGKNNTHTAQSSMHQRARKREEGIDGEGEGGRGVVHRASLMKYEWLFLHLLQQAWYLLWFAIPPLRSEQDAQSSRLLRGDAVLYIDIFLQLVKRLCTILIDCVISELKAALFFPGEKVLLLSMHPPVQLHEDSISNTMWLISFYLMSELFDKLLVCLVLTELAVVSHTFFLFSLHSAVCSSFALDVQRSFPSGHLCQSASGPSASEGHGKGNGEGKGEVRNASSMCPFTFTLTIVHHFKKSYLRGESLQTCLHSHLRDESTYKIYYYHFKFTLFIQKTYLYQQLLSVNCS